MFNFNLIKKTIFFNIVLQIFLNSVYIIQNKKFKKKHLINIIIFYLLHIACILLYNNSIFSILFKFGLISYFLTLIPILFMSIGILETIRKFYFYFRYNKFCELFNRQAQIVDYYKIDGKEYFILNSYIPINSILAKEKDIEQYLNTNVVSINHVYDTNKRIIEIKCSKLRISEYSGVVSKLINKLKKLNYSPDIINFEENDFYYIVNCKLTAELNQVKNKLTEIVFSVGSPILLEAKNDIFTFKIHKSAIQKYDFVNYIASKKDESMILPFIIGLCHKTAKPVFVDLTKVLHTFINGITNSGKSCLFNCIIQSLQLFNSNNICMLNVDFKRNEFFDYQFIDNQIYIYEMEVFKKLLKYISGEIDRRYKEFKNIKNIQDYNRGRTIKMPYIIICIDEVAFISNSGNEDLFKTLADLINRGRACGVIFICATQRPEHSVVPTNFRNQFESIFVGRLGRIEDNKICGIDKTIETPEFNTGQFLYRSISFNGMIQSFFIDDRNKKLNIVYSKLLQHINNCNSDNIPVNGKVCLDKYNVLDKKTIELLNNIKQPSKQVINLITEIENHIQNNKKYGKIELSEQKCTNKTPNLYMLFLNYIKEHSTPGQQAPTYNEVVEVLGNTLTDRNYKAIKKKACKEGYLYKKENNRFYIS